MDFKLHAPYSATGDQPEAIRKLTEGVRLGLDEQVLLGVTGSGKTFTMASVIANLNRPTLVLAHNKTLAAQLCSEFREFFPENAVEYFISYYDYYQPEAYIAHTDTYIEKDSAINDEIERLRHSATSSLFERRDVIVVSSVSCIYGLGDPIDYKNMVISLRTGMEKSREELMQKLVEIRYERNDLNFTRNTFRVRGDTVEIYPVYWSGRAIRVEFFGDEIDRISEINAVSGMPERGEAAQCQCGLLDGNVIIRCCVAENVVLRQLLLQKVPEIGSRPVDALHGRDLAAGLPGGNQKMLVANGHERHIFL